jgi:hypothetical protein
MPVGRNRRMDKYQFISYSAAQAIAAYRVARAINSDAGVVARTLRLLDALMVMDSEGLLVEVRNAAAGAAVE